MLISVRFIVVTPLCTDNDLHVSIWFTPSCTSVCLYTARLYLYLDLVQDEVCRVGLGCSPLQIGMCSEASATSLSVSPP